MHLPLEKSITQRAVAVVQVPPSLKRQAQEALAGYVRQSEGLFKKTFLMPTISFDLRGTVAGKAYLRENHVQLNAQLFVDNTAHFLNDTIAHEWAHIAARLLHAPKRIDAHGAEWRAVMSALGKVPSRCHSLDVSKSRVHATYTYRCNCKTFELSARRHNKVQRKHAAYQCQICHAYLQLERPSPDSKLGTPVTSAKPKATPPSPAALSHLKALATRLQRGFAPQALTDAAACQAAIADFEHALQSAAKNLDAPTQRQLDYAAALAKRNGLAPSPAVMASKRLLSAWISDVLQKSES